MKINPLYLNLGRRTQSSVAWIYQSVSTDVATNLTTLQDITDLGLSVTSGKAYFISTYLMFRSTANGNGIGVSFSSSGGAAGTFSFLVNIPSGNDGTNGLHSGSITSFGDTVLSTTVQSSNTDYIALMQGIFNCTTSGIIYPQFRSEVSSSTITVRAGSILEASEL